MYNGSGEVCIIESIKKKQLLNVKLDREEINIFLNLFPISTKDQNFCHYLNKEGDLIFGLNFNGEFKEILKITA
ncbi:MULTISPECIES: hypothetical protein [Priestia]|uniref:hypothetical protein n=1 Tax=Priestia TaxID=2800373 RepID=UPI001C8D3A0E|nr:hypothetical protein [Priestia aryabhattai]MBY0214420.1 hypothetical protein [Priestia aryabhattai]MDT0148413.1 hypothetical protein [Priestia aryabhattai]MDT0153721.1 hypothetical protein [Priestia aryabhattai]